MGLSPSYGKIIAQQNCFTVIWICATAAGNAASEPSPSSFACPSGGTYKGRGIKPLKKFLLFAFNTEYRCGGWNDLVDCYETLEAALSCASRSASERERWHIVDIESKAIVRAWNDELFKAA